MGLTVSGKRLESTEEGFLVNYNDWSEAVAVELAKENQLELTEAHWEIVRFMRNYYLQFKHLPNARVFTKAIKNQFGEDKGNSRYLHKLFPQGPLKFACKIAGIPKPPTCL